jgi:hypothetical protein
MIKQCTLLLVLAAKYFMKNTFGKVMFCCHDDGKIAIDYEPILDKFLQIKFSIKFLINERENFA